MDRRLVRLFAAGDLRPSSRADELPFIGEYLYDGLRRAFAPRGRQLTLRGLVRALGRCTAERATERIQRALQNDRANMCTGTYRIADVNTNGWRAVVALLRVAQRGDDGSGLGAGAMSRLDATRLRLPARRGAAAKRSGCVTERECRRRGDVWRSGLCMPRDADARGFDGVGAHPGQKSGRATRRARGSRYVRHPSERGAWRVASRRRQRRLALT